MKITNENLKKLKDTFEVQQNKKEELKAKQEEFNKSNEDLIKEIFVLNDQIGIQKKQLSEDGLADFKETESKQLLGGLGIKVGTRLIYETDAAFKWAQEHNLCLVPISLNKKEFEKIAKTQNIDCVTKEEKVTVTFPSEIKLGDDNNE